MSATPLELDRIQRADLCTGCGLCSAVAGPAIEMRMSPKGYLRPVRVGPVPERVDRVIRDACPGANLDLRAPEAPPHPDWGPLKAVRTGHATDPALRHRASSGGVLSALLIHLLESAQVDFVVQTAVSPTSPLLNAVRESTGRDDVFAAAGSRYAPSAPLERLDEHLARPGRFAFVGKPCDVAALRAYARHDPRVVEKVAFMISFMCGGIPSQHGTGDILEALGMREEEVAAFRFRGEGWPGRTTAVAADGRTASMTYDEAWGGILSKRVQFRCKICPDGTGAFADVVCADAWHGDERGYPCFEEQDGRSLILTRTRMGEDLVRAAEAAGAIRTEPLAAAEILSMQPFQAKRKRMTLSRLAAMAVLGRRLPRFRGLDLGRAALMGGAKANLVSFLGLARRLLRGRA